MKPATVMQPDGQQQQVSKNTSSKLAAETESKPKPESQLNNTWEFEVPLPDCLEIDIKLLQFDKEC